MPSVHARTTSISPMTRTNSVIQLCSTYSKISCRHLPPSRYLSIICQPPQHPCQSPLAWLTEAPSTSHRAGVTAGRAPNIRLCPFQVGNPLRQRRPRTAATPFFHPRPSIPRRRRGRVSLQISQANTACLVVHTTREPSEGPRS